jgi:hypothetical protein
MDKENRGFEPQRCAVEKKPGDNRWRSISAVARSILAIG